MASAIEVAIVFAAVGAVDFGGDDDLDVASPKDVDDPLLRIIGAIG